MAGFLARLPEVEKAAGIDSRKHVVVPLRDYQDLQYALKLIREAPRGSDLCNLRGLSDTFDRVIGVIGERG